MMGDPLGGHHQSGLEEYLEPIDREVIDLTAVNLQSVTLKALNLEGVDWEA